MKILSQTKITIGLILVGSLLLNGLIFWYRGSKQENEKELPNNTNEPSLSVTPGQETPAPDTSGVKVYNLADEDDHYPILDLGADYVKATGSFTVVEAYPIYIGGYSRSERVGPYVIEVYENADAFDYKNYDYFTLQAHVNYDVGKPEPDYRTVRLNLYSKTDDQLISPYTYFGMEKFDAENCVLYSFFKQSKTIFLSCVSSFDQQNQTYEFIILGFTLTTDPETLGTSLLGELTIKVDSENAYTPYFDTAIVKPDKYYLFYGDQAYPIVWEDGIMQLKSAIDLRFYDIGHTHPNYIQDKNFGYGYLIDHISPDGDYILYSAGIAGGVFDTVKDQVIPVDRSCFAKTGRVNQSGIQYFYNDTVDPFTGSPYKTVSLLKWVSRVATFEQTYCSGGGCAREGIITLEIGRDFVECQIDVKYEHLPD